MAIRTKSAIQAFFESGDKPTQQQFADWIDSCVFIPTAGATGIVEVESTASATTRTLGALGAILIGAGTTASALGNLGGSTVGQSVFTATNTASAQDKLGIGAFGRTVFQAVVTASVFNGLTEAITGHIESPTSGKSYVLDQAAPFSYQINSLVIKASAGTGTVAVKVDGVDVSGLAAVGVSAGSSNSAAATGGNSVATSARVVLIPTGLTSAADFWFTIKTTRT